MFVQLYIKRGVGVFYGWFWWIMFHKQITDESSLGWFFYLKSVITTVIISYSVNQMCWAEPDASVCVHWQKNVRSANTLELISCRFKPDQLMNRWRPSTNAATPSADTDGETKTFEYFMYIMLMRHRWLYLLPLD